MVEKVPEVPRGKGINQQKIRRLGINGSDNFFFGNSIFYMAAY